MADVMAGETVGVEVAVGVGGGDVEGAGGGVVETAAVAVCTREIGAVLEMVRFTPTTITTGVGQCQGKTIGGRKCPPHQRIDADTLFSRRMIDVIIVTRRIRNGSDWGMAGRVFCNVNDAFLHR